MIIYQQAQPVFVATGADSRQTPNRISDLLLTWYAADRDDDPPITLEHGQTVLYSVSQTPDNIEELLFLGRHPTKDVYYHKTIPYINVIANSLKYITNTYTYIVAGTQPLIYYVARISSGVSDGTVVQGAGFYMLVNEQVTGWTTGASAIIEPFNVIFDTIAEVQTPVITYADGSIPISGSVLTNTPIVSGATVNTAYAFNLVGNTLTLDKNTTNGVTSDETGVLSINGLTPIDGNINIKVLS